jgi:hypothetical protein
MLGWCGGHRFAGGSNRLVQVALPVGAGGPDTQRVREVGQVPGASGVAGWHRGHRLTTGSNRLVQIRQVTRALEPGLQRIAKRRQA